MRMRVCLAAGVMADLHIELLGSGAPTGKSGGLRAGLLCDFSMNGRAVSVCVHESAMRTWDGRMDPGDVKRAAGEFLRMRAGQVGWDQLPGVIELNEAAMDAVVERLGLRPRFRARSQRD
jgi:hypothetical protein